LTSGVFSDNRGMFVEQRRESSIVRIGSRVESMFDSCLKEMGWTPAEAGHCVTTVG